MLEITYSTQRLACPFFVSAVLFFLLQVAWGLTLALEQIDPRLLQGVINFNAARALHVNLAVVWIVPGLAGRFCSWRLSSPAATSGARGSCAGCSARSG